FESGLQAKSTSNMDRCNARNGYLPYPAAFNG
uniref:Uncharacterized protein n=1 Tax=Caenorhabditis japonica TaxID=281687 RepID=A0A8R1EPA9_CAEJA